MRKSNDANTTSQIEKFLKSCEVSSSEAYDKFKTLLAGFENPHTRTETRSFFTALESHCREYLSDVDLLHRFHFSLDRLVIGETESGEETLLLLQLPSVFAPEEWSFTFFEGLARYPTSEFQGRVVAELGTGNGWISLALSKKTQPAKMYGLDINPRATTCARINLYLNALNPIGDVIFDSEGKSLLDRVEFHTSDLLSYCLERGILLDKLIGCIPQVLSPDPAIAKSFIPEHMPDEVLYSLSNYTPRQGYIEDQFGLGLIAKAVEESVECTKPSAKIILNLGGRPGSQVLTRLFRRRGFQVKKIWETKVLQAADTDISPLVDIEKQSTHRFEFYMGLSSTDAVSAKTAMAYASRGGQIAHSLGVYEATLQYPNHVKKILKTIRKPGFEQAHNALDLAFDDTLIADEKIPFLADLAERLSKDTHFEYNDTRGVQSFRRHIAEFLRTYHRIPLTAKNVVVAPSRLAFIKNLFDVYSVSVALVEKEFARGLPAEWIQALPGENTTGPSVIETPRRVDLTCQLIEKLKPQLVVTGLAEFEQKTSDSFTRLIFEAAKIGARLVVDISSYFELSSTPQTNGVFQYLSENTLPQHVSIVCAFVRNRVYSDLEICFLVSENATLLDALVIDAEVTYSRAPILTQIYYDRILTDLLSFKMHDSRRERALQVRAPQSEAAKSPSLSPLNPSFLALSAHHAMKEATVTITPETIRMDYGENALPAPSLLKVEIFESFSRQHTSSVDRDPSREVAQFLEERFGITRGSDDHFVFANGVAPMFAGIAEQCALAGETLIFPQGSYGYFAAAALGFKAKTAIMETESKDSFKVTPKTLHSVLQLHKKAWLFLNAPVVNPTGAVYSPSEIYEILSVANLHGARVVLDVNFSGLEFNPPTETWKFTEHIDALPAPQGGFGGLEYVVLGGISKEFAAGGLRVGYAFTPSDALASAVRRGVTAEPHRTLKFALKSLYRQLNAHEPSLMSHMSEQRRILKQRALTLEKCLLDCGWETLPPNGGLFLVAKPASYFGKKIQIPSSNSEVVLSSSNFKETLFQSTGLLINGPEWTGLPDYCRFVLSIDERQFEKALERLRNFAKAVN